jgi:hypothetical protein
MGSPLPARRTRAVGDTRIRTCRCASMLELRGPRLQQQRGGRSPGGALRLCALATSASHAVSQTDVEINQ